MSPLDPNLLMLMKAAQGLGPLVRDVVFVGGAVVGLLITDEAAPEIRPTDDVDCVISVTSKSEWLKLALRLRAQGFKEDTSEDAPMCRFLKADLVIDVIPSEASILGFAGTWLSSAIPYATTRTLPDGTSILLISAPYFLASKLEAFLDRGGRDFANSTDLEDFVAVVDGRDAIVEEVNASPVDLRDYLRVTLSGLGRRLIDAVPGYLLPDPASQARVPLVQDRIARLGR